MTRRSWIVALAVMCLAGAAPVVADVPPPTTGTIDGVIRHQHGEPVAGVTIVAASPAVEMAQATLTEADGTFRITGLPPGVYLLTFYWDDLTVERQGIIVQVGKTTIVSQRLATSPPPPPTSPPVLDRTPPSGITIDDTYTRNIPTRRSWMGKDGRPRRRSR